jgi:hypothetical protein
MTNFPMIGYVQVEYTRCSTRLHNCTIRRWGLKPTKGAFGRVVPDRFTECWIVLANEDAKTKQECVSQAIVDARSKRKLKP